MTLTNISIYQPTSICQFICQIQVGMIQRSSVTSRPRHLVKIKTWPSRSWKPPAPATGILHFTGEAAGQKVTSIRKLSHFWALPLPLGSSCSHTAICHEATVPQGKTDVESARLLWKLRHLGGRPIPSFDPRQQHRLFHLQLRTGPVDSACRRLGFVPQRRVAAGQLDWYVECDCSASDYPKYRSLLPWLRTSCGLRTAGLLEDFRRRALFEGSNPPAFALFSHAGSAYTALRWASKAWRGYKCLPAPSVQIRFQNAGVCHFHSPTRTSHQ